MSPEHGDESTGLGGLVRQESSEFRSGFIALLGRPNVGKSTLVNQILGEKVSITARTPNTTRTRIRGVLEGEGFQAVFVDSPGIHRPRSLLGERLNEAARAGLDDLDLCLLVLDASAPIGSGDRMVVSEAPAGSIVVLSKCDRLDRSKILERLKEVADSLELVDAEYFPISARTGKGVNDLVEHIVGRLPIGPRYYPEGTVRDVPDAIYVAELVREQLLRIARDELPHSIACQVTEWEWPVIRCEILVERESQKGIVVGRGGAVLKAAGIAAWAQLPPGAFLELHVSVARDWQRRPDIIEDLGY